MENKIKDMMTEINKLNDTDKLSLYYEIINRMDKSIIRVDTIDIGDIYNFLDGEEKDDIHQFMKLLNDYSYINYENIVETLDEIKTELYGE